MKRPIIELRFGGKKKKTHILTHMDAAHHKIGKIGPFDVSAHDNIYISFKIRSCTGSLIKAL